MYLGEHPILHLVQRPPGEAARPDSGNVDHLAFYATGRDDLRALLVTSGVAFRETTSQVFITDPDGLKIEINFE
jgi:hypothetical protein